MYSKDGAEWFKSTDYGDDEDRVVIRANGEKTYFASDIAYHYDKRQRGHDLLIDVWGADHHGYVTRVRGALVALGAPGDCFEVTLMQLVSLFRGGEKLSMGKREGNFVTLRDLRNEVGNDACRPCHSQIYESYGRTPMARTSGPAASGLVTGEVTHLRSGMHYRVFSDTTGPTLAFLRSGDRAISGRAEKTVVTALSRSQVLYQAALNRAPHAWCTTATLLTRCTPITTRRSGSSRTLP
jgi:hypothetical protein